MFVKYCLFSALMWVPFQSLSEERHFCFRFKDAVRQQQVEHGSLPTGLCKIGFFNKKSHFSYSRKYLNAAVGVSFTILIKLDSISSFC